MYLVQKSNFKNSTLPRLFLLNLTDWEKTLDAEYPPIRLSFDAFNQASIFGHTLDMYYIIFANVISNVR